jgi:hypothetical protein|tara:strand:- start:2836 stop:3144 length:309 start_codon:yes stop_codon:yes gene_type:complete
MPNELRNFQIAIGNEYMYMDVDEFMKQIELAKLSLEDDGEEDKNVSINLPKFEFFKLMLDVCLGYAEEVDDTLGQLGLNKTTIPFRLAINTLIEYKILKKCK